MFKRVLVFCIALTAAATTAPRPGAAADQPSVRLLSQPAWTPVGGDFGIAVDVEPDDGKFALRAVAYRALSSRSAFLRTVEGEGLGNTVSTVTADLETLPRQDNAFVFPLALQNPDATRDNARLQLLRTGVYPLEVQLVDTEDDKVVDKFVTHVVVIGDTTNMVPLDVAWVWRLQTGPTRRPNGTISNKRVDEINDRITGLASQLPKSVPVSVVPGPDTIETWAQQPEAQLSSLNNAAQLISAPYVPTNFSALSSAGLADTIRSTLALGSDALSETLERRIDARTLVQPELNREALEALRTAGVDRVVVDDTSLVPSRSSLTTSRPFELQSSEGNFDAAQNDTALVGLLEDNNPLAAQNFLAGLAMLALETPNAAHGAVVVMPQGWNPKPSTTDLVVTGLRDSPMLNPTSLDKYFAEVPAEQNRAARLRRLSNANDSALRVGKSEYDQARNTLLDFQKFAGANNAYQLAQRVLISSLATGIDDGNDYASGATGIIDDFLRKVRVPQNRTITITSRNAEIPLTFENGTDQELSVRVALESDKLEFPNAGVSNREERIVTLPPRSTTQQFPVKVRSSGAFPVVVTVTSPDGSIELERSRLTIRSAAFTNVGLLITGGAFAFLALWWGRHIILNRKRTQKAEPETT